MKLLVGKSCLKGQLKIPGSKSHTIRALAIASMAKGTSCIKSPLSSSDTESAVNCYRILGADINTSDTQCWEITGTAGKIFPRCEVIDVGNSGTTLRIAMGSASLAEPDQRITFTGDEQIQSRPLGALMDALENLGAKCRSLKNNQKAPVQISGKIKGGQTNIAASTSQYLSSLLLCTPLAQNATEIDVTLLNEPDYVQMTLDWLDKQKIEYKNQGMNKFFIKPNQSYTAFDEKIPADFSSATFFLCAAAVLAEKVTIYGLDLSDSQPDKRVIDYLIQMGADITVDENSITVKKADLKGIKIDMNRTPDALPAMAVTAAFAEGQTSLVNVAQARHKETDRIRCMAEELKKMNADIEELPDGLIIRKSKLNTAELNGHSDHRIVMALSLAAMAAEGTSTVNTAEAIDVTFPDFVELMQSIGGNMKLSD